MTFSQKLMILRWLHAPVLTLAFLVIGAWNTSFGTLTIFWLIWWADRGRVLIAPLVPNVSSFLSGKSSRFGHLLSGAPGTSSDASLWQKITDYVRQAIDVARIKASMGGYLIENCCLGRTADSVARPWATLHHVQITEHGYQLRLLVDSDKRIEFFEHRRGEIGRALGISEVRPFIKEPGVIALDVLRIDPLAQVVSILTADMPAYESIAVALDESGKQVRLGILESHILMGGIPGSGKSGGLSAMLYGLSILPDVALIGIDPKQVELAPWKSRFSEIVTDLDQATMLLTSIAEEMERRYTWLVEAGRKKITTDDLSTMPLIVLVVDELAEVLAAGMTRDDKAADAQRATLIRRLIAKGRAAGIVCILATQKPASDVVPTGLRDLIPQRVGFATTTPEMTDTILGSGAGKEAPSHTISASEKGVCYIATEDSRLGRKARFFWLPDADCVIHAEATSSLRVPLPWLRIFRGN